MTPRKESISCSPIPPNSFRGESFEPLDEERGRLRVALPQAVSDGQADRVDMGVEQRHGTEQVIVAVAEQLAERGG